MIWMTEKYLTRQNMQDHLTFCMFASCYKPNMSERGTQRTEYRHSFTLLKVATSVFVLSVSALSTMTTHWAELCFSLLDVESGPSDFCICAECLCEYLFIRLDKLHMCESMHVGLKYRGTSGWHYIITGPGGVSNVDIASGLSKEHQEC